MYLKFSQTCGVDGTVTHAFATPMFAQADTVNGLVDECVTHADTIGVVFSDIFYLF